MKYIISAALLALLTSEASANNVGAMLAQTEKADTHLAEKENILAQHRSGRGGRRSHSYDSSSAGSDDSDDDSYDGSDEALEAEIAEINEQIAAFETLCDAL